MGENTKTNIPKRWADEMAALYLCQALFCLWWGAQHKCLFFNFHPAQHHCVTTVLLNSYKKTQQWVQKKYHWHALPKPLDVLVGFQRSSLGYDVPQNRHKKVAEQCAFFQSVQCHGVRTGSLDRNYGVVITVEATLETNATQHISTQFTISPSVTTDREGSILKVYGPKATLLGQFPARYMTIGTCQPPSRTIRCGPHPYDISFVQCEW